MKLTRVLIIAKGQESASIFSARFRKRRFATTLRVMTHLNVAVTLGIVGTTRYFDSTVITFRKMFAIVVDVFANLVSRCFDSYPRFQTLRSSDVPTRSTTTSV